MSSKKDSFHCKQMKDRFKFLLSQLVYAHLRTCWQNMSKIVNERKSKFLFFKTFPLIIHLLHYSSGLFNSENSLPSNKNEFSLLFFPNLCRSNDSWVQICLRRIRCFRHLQSIEYLGTSVFFIIVNVIDLSHHHYRQSSPMFDNIFISDEQV